MITSIFLVLIGSLIAHGLKLEDKKATVIEDRTLARLVYDRKSPEQGFVITTIEKKSKR